MTTALAATLASALFAAFVLVPAVTAARTFVDRRRAGGAALGAG